MGLVDLLISVLHPAFTNFESYDAPISGLRVLGSMRYHGFSIWSLSSTSYFASMCFVLQCVGDFYVTLGISAKPATMHNCALVISIDPNRLLMPSGQMVRLKYGRITWFNSETNHPADEKGERSEIRNETGSNGRIESVCCFCVFNLSAESRFYISLTNESP